jgi:phosphoribosyl-ATP pyrophosphohydrolase/phosphoribosyl-AMP cyclohydrolase
VKALSELAFDARGLVPVIAQDALSGEVLMLAWADREALERTLETGEAHYFSRSRRELWRKGATSGHHQQVLEVRFDCDADAVLYRVLQSGAACHTGQGSCFYRTLTDAAAPSLGEAMALLERVVAERLRTLPEGSYVGKLHERGLGYVAQKVVEEAGESIVAALEHKDEELLGEVADLLFHVTVLLHERGSSLHDVAQLLAARHRERSAPVSPERQS